MTGCEEGDHAYSTRQVTHEWYGVDDRERRDVIPTPICTECGEAQPARWERPPKYVDERYRKGLRPPESTEDAQVVAEHVLRRAEDHEDGEPRPCQGLFSRLAKRGVNRSRAEALLERFLEAGWVFLRWNVEGPDRVLHAVAIEDREALVEFARPGQREALEEARRAALDRLEGVEGETADAVERLIDVEEGLGPSQMRVLAAVAEHAASGEQLHVRVASSRLLGDSKAIERHRSIVQTRLGSFEELGLSESSHLERIGGTGSIELGDETVTVEELAPFVGLSAETVERIEAIEPGDGVVVFVENGVPFEACARGEVGELAGALIVYTDGIPSSGVQSIAEKVAGHRVLVWADIDPEGVLIYEILNEQTGGAAEPYRMGPEDLRAEEGQDLSDNKRARLERMLDKDPGHALAPTLEALDEHGYWVEQERFL